MTMETFSRRDFLKTARRAGRHVLASPSAGRRRSEGAAAPAKTVALDQVDGFIAIDAKGNVTVYSGKVDLGTGVRTALAQIAAEELSVPFERVTLVQGDTALTPDQGTTWAASSIQAGGMQIRQACATAREALLARPRRSSASRVARLTVEGRRAARAGGKTVSYAGLIGGKSFEMKVDPKAPLKPPATTRSSASRSRASTFPARSPARSPTCRTSSVPACCTRGWCVRPAMKARSCSRVDDSAAEEDPGLRRHRAQGQLPRVVAKNEWAAIRCAERDRRRSGRTGRACPTKAKLWDHVRKTKVVKRRSVPERRRHRESDADRREARSRATYDFAVHTHGSIGPSCAVADYKDGKLTVWTASQATHMLRRQLAKMFSMKADNVRCIYVEGSGCYGRNGHEDAAADAALIAKEIGRPVRVQWIRAGRARLGSERPADAARVPRGARRRRQRRGMGIARSTFPTGRKASR